MSTLQFAKGISRLGTESAFTVLARAQQLAASGQDIINLGIGQPDFRTPEHIVQAGIKALQDGQTICGGVAVMTILQCLDPRLHNMLRRSEIRLPNAKVNNVLSTGCQLLGTRQYRKGRLGSQT